jgi:hypothetical protein
MFKPRSPKTSLIADAKTSSPPDGLRFEISFCREAEVFLEKCGV